MNTVKLPISDYFQFKNQEEKLKKVFTNNQTVLEINESHRNKLIIVQNGSNEDDTIINIDNNFDSQLDSNGFFFYIKNTSTSRVVCSTSTYSIEGRTSILPNQYAVILFDDSNQNIFVELLNLSEEQEKGIEDAIVLDRNIFRREIEVIEIQDDFSDIGTSGKEFALYAIGINTSGNYYFLVNNQLKDDLRNCNIILKPVKLNSDRDISDTYIYVFQTGDQTTNIDSNYFAINIIRESLLEVGDVFEFYYERHTVSTPVSTSLWKNGSGGAKSLIPIYDTETTIDASSDYTFAINNNTTASGNSAFASGFNTTASGFASASFNRGKSIGATSFSSGYNCESNGTSSFSSGHFSKANGTVSCSFNQGTAEGSYTTAFGVLNTAQSYGEFVLGTYGTEYTPASTEVFNSSDRLFSVGNGTSTSTRSDAFIIYKNGKLVAPSLDRSSITNDKDLVTKEYIDNLNIGGTTGTNTYIDHGVITATVTQTAPTNPFFDNIQLTNLTGDIVTSYDFNVVWYRTGNMLELVSDEFSFKGINLGNTPESRTQFNIQFTLPTFSDSAYASTHGLAYLPATFSGRQGFGSLDNDLVFKESFSHIQFKPSAGTIDVNYLFKQLTELNASSHSAIRFEAKCPLIIL